MQTSADGETAALTGTADLLGTPAYMAPELARGRRACPRTEVYSVGVVAFQMLTGRVPFRGDSPFDALFRAATEPTPPLRSFEPSVPEAVEALVMRMLAKDPQDRFGDMGEVLAAIATIDELGLVQATGLHGPPGLNAAIAPTGPYAAIPDAPAMPMVAVPATPPLPPVVTVPMPTPPTGPYAFVAQQSSPSMQASARTSARAAIVALLAIGVIATIVAVAIALSPDDPSLATPAPETARASTIPTSTPPPSPTPRAAGPAARPELDPAVPAAEPADADAGVELVIDDEPTVPAAARKPAPARAPAAKPTPRPDDPPSDATVLRKLQRQAKSKCGALLGGEPLRVTFGIGQRGEVIAPRGNRRGAAADCVIGVLGQARFAPGNMRREVLTL